METTFIFGINLLVAVPTTLRSVQFASYPPSKDYPRNTAITSSSFLIYIITIYCGKVKKKISFFFRDKNFTSVHL